MNDRRQCVEQRSGDSRLHLSTPRRGPPALLPDCTVSWCIGDRHCSTALLALPFFLKLVAEDRQLLVLRATSRERRNVHTRLQGTESVPRNLECCEKNCDSCEEEKELMLGLEEHKAPLLKRRRRGTDRASRAVCWPWACAWSSYRLLSRTDTSHLSIPHGCDRCRRTTDGCDSRT
jgi:hypothetical protein